MIRKCRKKDIPACAYLEDYFNAEKFSGFVTEENGKIIGAMFAHEKIWWNNSELFILILNRSVDKADRQNKSSLGKRPQAGFSPGKGA